MRFNKYRTGVYKKNFIAMNSKMRRSFAFAALKSAEKDCISSLDPSGNIPRKIKLDIAQMESYLLTSSSLIAKAILRDLRPLKN